MSSITDMVIVCSGDEDEAMARVNEWCVTHDDRQQRFERLDTEAAGGNKVFTPCVWAMAGNYFPHWKLAEEFASFGWRYPEEAVLIIIDHHDEVARVYAGG